MTRLLCLLLPAAAFGFANGSPADSRWIEEAGGTVVRAEDGSVAGVSLARTWATDNDMERLIEMKQIKRLDLSFTYITDKGIERLQKLDQLEELILDTTEFITDAAMSYLRANRNLRKLVLRGTDITDVGLPYIAALTSLRSLDLSHTMIGDVGLESLPALAELEELNLGANRISGINFNFLKLLPKLRKLGLGGIQRRNGGACWAPQITDLDLEAISKLEGLEELNLGVGLGLGKAGMPAGAGNCRIAGGTKITDLGLVKLARLTSLRRLDVSGAKVSRIGLAALQKLPKLDRLSLWNCPGVDDSAAELWSAFPALANLDLSETSAGDETLTHLSRLTRLKSLYLTDTKISASAADAFRKQRPDAYVSWARREPRSAARP